MKNLNFTFLLTILMISIVLFNSCKKDPDPDNNQPILVYDEIIIGMTGLTSKIEINATDPDGDELSYTWTIVTSPSGSSPVFNQIMNRADFTTSIPGIYVVEVVVKDNKGSQAVASINLYIGGELPSNINSNTVLPDLFPDEAYPDYYATRSVQVTAGLTLEPGVVIENSPEVTIFINGTNAWLEAKGTSSKYIIFRGSEKVRGCWKTININSPSQKNHLDYVKIMHAGSSAIQGNKTAIYLKSNTANRASVTNSVITMNDGYGIFVDGNENGLVEFFNNEITDNAAAALIIGAENLYSLDKASTYSGNGINAIVVKSSGNTNVRFMESGTIKNLGINYEFESSIELRTTVTFEKGVTCLFASEKRLWVTSEGGIIADGTAQEKITFSGKASIAGDWHGIEMDSFLADNKINYAVISYGGSITGRKANIYMFNNSRLTLTNSTISDSQTWGVFLAPGSIQFSESNNTFINNASGNIGGL